MRRLFLSAIAALALALPTVALANASERAPAETDANATAAALCDSGAEGICLYQGTNYTGAGEYWGWAVAQLPVGWNDTAVSVRNTFKFDMYVYSGDQYSGARLRVAAKSGYTNLGSIPTGGTTWARQITSFRNS